MIALEEVNEKMKDQLKENYDMSMGPCEHSCGNCNTNRRRSNNLKVEFQNLENHKKIKTKVKLLDQKI